MEIVVKSTLVKYVQYIELAFTLMNGGSHG